MTPTLVTSCAAPPPAGANFHWAARRKIVDSPAIVGAPLLSVREEWGVAFAQTSEMIDIRGALSANNAEVLKEFAIQGMGIALLPHFVVEDALADGRLRQVLPGFCPVPFGLYAVRLSRQFTPARVRLFVEFLRESLGEARAPADRS